MPGNELDVVKYLIKKRGKVELPHLGLVKSIRSPGNSLELTNESDVYRVCSDDASKKADILINDIGVSIKQKGSTFSFNRLQRANLHGVFKALGFSSCKEKLALIDQEVWKFHAGKLDRRNRPWKNFFEKEDFKSLLKFLMMDGSPNKGRSAYPAKLVLEAPPWAIKRKNISLYDFDEYFSKFKGSFKIAIRRQWIGQSSNSEHKRALGLSKKLENKPWVFDEAVGFPRKGWNISWAESDRKTVYFLMIEKEAG
tara:strand:+ start:199 stop:960 length:762 start_codon:yes stop_codon:yes gene_type:complete